MLRQMTAISTSHELVRFLLARVDDDDTALRKLARVPDHAPVAPGYASLERLQAECLAKRRIIGAAQQLLALRDQPSEKPVREAATQVLRSLASAYADHSAFREEWRTSSRR